MTAVAFAQLSLASTDPLESSLKSSDEILNLGDPADGDLQVVQAVWRDASTCRFRHPQHSQRSFLFGPTDPCSVPSASFHPIGQVPEGDMPSSAAYSIDGSTLIVAHRDSRNLVLYDANTYAYLRSISISGGPQAIAVHPDGTHVVTVNVDTETMSMVDLNTGVEELVVSVGTMPGSVAITADGTRAIVGNTGDSTISIIDLDSGAQLHLIEDASFTMTLTVAPESGAVSLAFSDFVVIGSETIVHPSSFSDEILFIDIQSGATTSVTVGDWPRGIDKSVDEATVVVSQYNQPFITVLDVASETVLKTISIVDNAWGPIALSGDGTRAAVAVLNAVRVVDLEDESVSSPLSTATVYDLLTTGDGMYALGVGYKGSLIDFEAAAIVANVNNEISTPVGAVSPTDSLAAMAANVFGEDLVFCSTNGTDAERLETRASGPDPEGDICRSVAVHPTGASVASLGLFSGSVEIHSAAHGDLLGRYSSGKRPSELAFSPDGSKVVVANLDSYHATIIDLMNETVVDASISWRASRVVVSPDSRYAYVSVVASGDGVWRIDLDTGAPSGGKLTTGNMGSVGYAYSRTSGIALSHDGSTLVTCDSFSDTVTVIDTDSWSVVATVPVGGFPTLATFSADDSILYVSQRNDNAIARLQIDGANSAYLESIPVGGQPKQVIPTTDQSTLYVLKESGSNIATVDLIAGVVDSEVTLSVPPRGFALSPSEDCLIVGCGTQVTSAGQNGYSRTQSGEIQVLDAATLDLQGSFDTGRNAAQFVFDSEQGIGAIASIGDDGILLISVESSCAADLDGDSDVDGADLTILLSEWGSCSDCVSDLTGDGEVAGADLTVLLSFWGACP